MSQLEISLLGSFQARFNGADITDCLRTRKERAILAFLAEESRHAQTRERVAEFFWPERPESYARMNLRQALLGIRRAFGSEEYANGCLNFSEDNIQLNPRVLSLDTQNFSQGILAIKNHNHPNLTDCTTCIEGLEGALKQYRGGFLQDMMLGDVLEFQEWLVMHRERYFNQVLVAVQMMSEIYYQRADYQLAHQYAWRYLELAPLEEAAHRMLMRLLAISGRRNAALQQYEACRMIVERELGLSPSAETRQLYEQIRNEHLLINPETRPLFGEPGQMAYRSPPVEAQLYDPVTQVPTRPLYVDRLKHAVTRMARDQQMAGVCMLTILFPTEEELSADLQRQIQLIAIRRITGCLRQADTVALLNAYEFGLLVENVSGAEGLQVIADKLAHMLTAPISLQGRHILLGIAIGVSLYPQDSQNADDLLSMADASMHRARIRKTPYLFSSS
jgi:DNA-binding SARP family transcriptional activator